MGKRSPIEPAVSPAISDAIKSRRSFRFQINHAKLFGAHSSVVNRLAANFEAASRAARISLRNDFRESITAKCREAQQASEDADWRKFFQIEKCLSTQKSYSSIHMLGVDGTCVYYEDFRSASQNYFSKFTRWQSHGC